MGPEAKASRIGYREQAKSEVSIQRSDGKCRLDPFSRDSRLVNRTDGPVPRPRDPYHSTIRCAGFESTLHRDR